MEISNIHEMICEPKKIVYSLVATPIVRIFFLSLQIEIKISSYKQIKKFSFNYKYNEDAL
jgi:hypothetical protein